MMRSIEIQDAKNLELQELHNLVMTEFGQPASVVLAAKAEAESRNRSLAHQGLNRLTMSPDYGARDQRQLSGSAPQRSQNPNSQIQGQPQCPASYQPNQSYSPEYNYPIYDPKTKKKKTNMSIPSSTIKIENGVNKKSWRNFQIYDGTNFASFESSLKDALEIAGVWKIVTGIDKEPSENKSCWEMKAERAVVIIAGSNSSFFRAETIRDAINSRDAAGPWKAVTTLNQKSNDSRENVNVAIDNPQYTRDDYLLLPHIA
ncbi:hypothetical protein K3495_g8882 [Podosphaera aphanis]|nr:hypothetical protein K3495_g8882 [Podosphaera aphanis]